MSVRRIVCLANSYKHDHRCVAGIDLSNKKWVRLIGNEIAGCMTLSEASYAAGNPIDLLDVFEVELCEPCGTECQPENMRIAKGSPIFFRKFDRPSDARLLKALKAKAGQVLQGYRDRVYAGPIENPVAKSLELIRPDDLWWWIRNDGKRKNRALFRSNRTRFDLAVTDPAWLERLSTLDPGIYPHSHFFVGTNSETFLTISMSEPFERFRYKLVAGVVQIT